MQLTLTRLPMILRFPFFYKTGLLCTWFYPHALDFVMNQQLHSEVCLGIGHITFPRVQLGAFAHLGCGVFL